MTEPIRADRVDSVDLRTADQRDRDDRRRRVEQIRRRREAIRKAGGDVASSPDLAADLEARLRRADKKVGK